MYVKIAVYLLIAAASLLALSVFAVPFLSHKALAPDERAKVTVGDRVFYVDVARTVLEKANGLSGRDALGEDEGMLFVFKELGNYSFWMKGMKFPLDIIWIRGDRVLGVSQNAQPEPFFSGLKIYYPPGPVDRVLELNAGSAERYDIREGNRIALFDIR
ncbi:MAG: DUF192 domain-containing protein [Patescibacteria group bacterium]